MDDHIVLRALARAALGRSSSKDQTTLQHFLTIEAHEKAVALNNKMRPASSVVKSTPSTPVVVKSTPVTATSFGQPAPKEKKDALSH